jgi:hypothetical protein
VPINPVLAPDIAGVDVNELHFLHDEAGAGDLSWYPDEGGQARRPEFPPSATATDRYRP